MSWDAPQFPQGYARRAVSLRCLVAHAREIVRSDPAYHPVLIQHPQLRSTAANLAAAAEVGAEMPVLIGHARTLARTLIFVRDQSAKRSADPAKKGTVARDVVEAARQRKAEASRPTNLKFPADSLFGGLQ